MSGPGAAEDGALHGDTTAARSQEQEGKKQSNMQLFLDAHKTFDTSNLIMQCYDVLRNIHTAIGEEKALFLINQRTTC